MAQLDTIDIRTAPSNLNREDVLNQIIDISKIPLPFHDMIGRSTHTAPKFEFLADRLPDPDITNAVIDGSDSTTTLGDPAKRLFNLSQISEKTVATSTRLEAANVAGYEKLARQVMKFTQALQRDMEAISILNQASGVDTGVGGTAGKTAGLEAWLDDEYLDETTARDGVSGSTGFPLLDISTGGVTSWGGWTNRSGDVIPAIVYTAATDHNALSFADLKAVINALWNDGCNPTKLMARPGVIEELSAFMFTSSAQIASLTRDRGEMGSAQAQSSVNCLLSDHGVIVDFIPNRLMQGSGDGTPVHDTLFVFDPQYFSISTMGGGIRSKELASSGLNRTIQIHCDWGLRVDTPEALGGIVGIDIDAAVTA